MLNVLIFFLNRFLPKKFAEKVDEMKLKNNNNICLKTVLGIHCDKTELNIKTRSVFITIFVRSVISIFLV